MKRTILAAVLALASATVLATGNQNQGGCIGNCGDDITNNYNNTTYNQPQGGTGVGIGVGIGKGGDAEANASSRSTSASKSDATAVSGAAAVQAQKAEANNAGNRQDVRVAFNEAKQRLQAPGVAVGATTTTAICMVAVQGGLSLSGVGLGGGTAIRDDICTMVQYGEKLMDIGAKNNDFAMFERGFNLVDEASKQLVDKYLPKKDAAPAVNPLTLDTAN